jgi:hypothetical protein
MTSITLFGFLQKQRRLVLSFVAVSFMLALGQHVPATGFLLNGLDNDAQEQLTRFSVFSAGIASWFIVWALFQIFSLVKHRWQSQSPIAAQPTNPFDVRILLFVLVLTSFEWFNLLNNVVPFYTQTAVSTPQLIIGIVTGLAGFTAFYQVGRWLDALTAGFGFWSLIALSNLQGFGSSLYSELQFLLTAELPRNLLILSLLLMLLSVVAAVMLANEKPDDRPISLPVILSSLLLSAIVAQWLAPFIYLPMQPFLPQLNEHLPVIIINQAYRCVAALVQAALLVGFVLLFVKKSIGNKKLWFIAMLLVILVFANEMNILLGGVGWSQVSPLSWIIIAWAATKVLKAYLDYCGPVLETVRTYEDDFDENFRRGWRSKL